MKVELQQLRYFLAVAEELNFTRAAARMSTDQPALSRQIRRLEQALGTALFVRTTRQVALTPAGRVLLDGAQRVLGDLDTLLGEVRTQADRAPSRVRLGWLIPFRGQLMARLVRAFEQASGARVELVRFDFTDPSAGLGRGLVDAAIVNPPIGTKGLRFTTLLIEPRVLLLANNHPLARRSRVTLADLDRINLTWAVPPSRDRVWQSYWTAADLPGRQMPTRRREFPDNQDYLQAVAAGHVVGLSLTAAIGDALPDYGITAVPVTDLGPATIALARRASDPNPLLSTLEKVAEALAPSTAQPEPPTGDGRSPGEPSASPSG